MKESSGAPQRSETAHSDTQRNLVLPLHCIHPNDLLPEIHELLVLEECNAKAPLCICVHGQQ